MKHIRKGDEPEFFAAWKEGDSEDWNPDWKAFSGDAEEKNRLTEHLIDEQGGLCCYCNRELRDGDLHMEHFKPRSRFKDLELDYTNLLISCQNKLRKPEPKHCGMKKGNWFDEDLMVSPFESDCEERFHYLGHGGIRPAPGDHSAKETIGRLGLDAKKLKELRKSAIYAALEDLEADPSLTPEELINAFLTRSPATNRFTPFCIAVVQVLRTLV